MKERGVISPMRYNILADTIVGKHVREKGDLKGLIKNAIIDREFTPQQIARLCQLVNVKVYQKLFEENEDKLFEFKPVDYREIVQELEMPEGPDERIITPRKELWDINIGDFITDTFWRHLKGEYGIEKPKKEKLEEDEFINKVVDTDRWGLKPSPIKRKIALEKMEFLVQRLQEAQRRIKMKMNAILNRIKEHLKQDYLEKVDLDLPYTAVTRETGGFGEKIFKDIVEILKGERVIKEAEYTPKVRTDRVKTSINPGNPLVVQMHQLVKYKKDYATLHKAIDKTQRKLQYVRLKMEGE